MNRWDAANLWRNFQLLGFQVNHSKLCCFCWISPALISVRPSNGIRNEHTKIDSSEIGNWSTGWNLGETYSEDTPWRFHLMNHLMNWLHNTFSKWVRWMSHGYAGYANGPISNGQNVYSPDPFLFDDMKAACFTRCPWRRQHGRTLAKALDCSTFVLFMVKLGCGMGQCGRDTICIY